MGWGAVKWGKEDKGERVGNKGGRGVVIALSSQHSAFS